MKQDGIWLPALNNTKNFVQQQVKTANASGFGAAADDYAERGIDLNEELVKNKPATFFMRVNSTAMKEAGIAPGDVVIVDRSLPAQNGKIVIAAVDGDLLIRRLEIQGKNKRLVPATSQLASISFTEGDLKIWGVVTYVIHTV